MAMIFLTSCNSGNKKYQVAENGVTYKFYKQDKNGEKPVVGNYVTVVMDFRVGDSILQSTKDFPYPVQIPIIEPAFKGDLASALTLMSPGDSASFMFNADSVFSKMFKGTPLPPMIKKTDTIYYDVKLVNILTEEQFQEEQNKAREEQLKKFMEETKPQREASAAKLEKYIKDNNITAQPDENGLYVIITKKTKGDLPKAGDKIAVNYTGKTLDGKVFDSSFERDQPIEFVLGQGSVIKGWDLAFQKIHVGETATIIIPQDLAYGSQQRGQDITPFSNLVFDVKLEKIVK